MAGVDAEDVEDAEGVDRSMTAGHTQWPVWNGTLYTGTLGDTTRHAFEPFHT